MAVGLPPRYPRTSRTSIDLTYSDRTADSIITEDYTSRSPGCVIQMLAEQFNLLSLQERKHLCLVFLILV